MPITTIDDLRAHVALATRVELSTIPPYLFAMYSIRDQQSAPARLLASIAVEEMLHVCLTTNLLLALGAEPTLNDGEKSAYPRVLPHHRPALSLELRRCSHRHIREMFMEIERPRPIDADPEDDDFETLGQFYASIEEALGALSIHHDLFDRPQSERQLSNPAFYGPVAFDAADSGGLMLIDDLPSAQTALELVIHQGEGVASERWADASHQELTHYAKLQLLSTMDLGEVWPVVDNPREDLFPAHVRVVSELFNALYQLTLITLDALFTGHAQEAEVKALYLLMEHALAPTARHLVTLPIDGEHHAGPTFETYEFEGDPWVESARLAREVGAAHPELAGIAQRLMRPEA